MDFIETLKYIFLGFIQGFTESLPISSSGHLLIFKTLMDVNVDFDTLAILTNVGSLVAILILFRKDLLELIKSFFGFITTKQEKYKRDFRYCLLIMIGCIPAGITGLLVKKLNILDAIEGNVKIVGISLIITAILLYIIRNFNGKKEKKDLTIKDALKVGMFQIIGVLPGISRSGSTIVGGMFSNLKRDTAFVFSFMLYIPMSIAALLLEIKDLIGTTISSTLWLYYIVATIMAGILTFLTTKWFRKIVNEGKLGYFSMYCILVGILVIIFL